LTGLATTNFKLVDFGFDPPRLVILESDGDSGFCFTNDIKMAVVSHNMA